MNSKTMRTLAAITLALTAACADDAFVPDTETVSQALTREQVLVIPRAFWQVSPQGGDRGTAWREPGYRPGDHFGWAGVSAPLGYGETYVNEIPYGSDTNNKPPTVYFRYTFAVNDRAKLKGLRLAAMFDDGVVVYINGQEVHRASMPAGPVTYDTLALSHEANNTYVSYDLTAALGAVVQNDNSIAVEVHQASRSSSDLVFDLVLYGQFEDSPPQPTVGGIARRQYWSYWDAGGDLGTAWRAPSYDEGAWRVGSAPLGYGENYIETRVDSGPSATNKHVTTYFRKDFTVDDPSSVTRMMGELMYDDGVIVYLNGQRIGSAAMPSGTATASTLALGHEAGNVYEAFDWTAQRSLLVAGVNTFAVEVHQQSPSSSDLVFDLSVALETAPRTAATVARRATWRLWDRGGDLGTAWRSATFADGTWATGAGPLGYGESYLGTTIGYGPNASSKYVTTYFRKKFTVDMPAGSSVTSMLGELMYDDGIVVYLNGQEIARRSMPPGPITAATAALAHEAGNVYETYNLSAAGNLIVNGENVLAVEVHQAGASSSDLVFDLALEILSAPAFTRYPGNPVVQPSGGDPSWRTFVHAPSVIQAGPGSWVMYFTAKDNFGRLARIGRAVSSDGIQWTLDAEPGRVGAAVSVLHDGAIYRMYFVSDLLEEGIQLYTSSDGVNWTGHGTVLAEGYSAEVIQDGSLFKMWYVGPTTVGVGYATSLDGMVWTRRPPTNADFTPSVVIKDGAGYKAWFREYGMGCRYASSPDGLTWTKGGLSLADGAAGSWDAPGVDCSAVVRDGSGLKMWYGSEGGIGYATSP